MLVTNDFINRGRNGPGGWKREQLAIIGVPWPPTKGWKKQAIGRKISEKDAERFLQLNGAEAQELTRYLSYLLFG